MGECKLDQNSSAGVSGGNRIERNDQVSPAFFLIAIQNRNPVWYQALTHGLNEEQRKQLQDIATLADQRRAAHGMLLDPSPL